MCAPQGPHLSWQPMQDASIAGWAGLGGLGGCGSMFNLCSKFFKGRYPKWIWLQTEYPHRSFALEPGLDRPQDCVWVAPRVQGVKPSQRLPHRPPPTVNHGFINHSDVYAAVAHFCIWAVVSANQNFNLFPPSWLANRLKLSRQDPFRSKGSHLR